MAINLHHELFIPNIHSRQATLYIVLSIYMFSIIKLLAEDKAATLYAITMPPTSYILIYTPFPGREKHIY